MIKEQSVMKICNKYSIDYSWNGDDIVFNWPEKVSISMGDLWKEIDADWEVWLSQEYARNRASAYDSVGDQLDQLMKDMRDGTTTHQTACEAVKAKYPKP
jgi:hypothetical protein